MTNRDREVVNCIRSCVKIKSKLTNLMKISRIKGYNDKYGSNPQGITKFLMISSNLIKLDDESMIKIGKNDIL